MATRTVYVDGNGGSATPTDPTLISDPYNSLLNCEAGERGDLVTATTTLVIVLLDGTWNETAEVVFDSANWTTDGTYDVTVQPQTNFGTTLRCQTNTYGDIIRVNGDIDITFQDFDMDHQGAVGSQTHGCIHLSGNGNGVIQRMTMRGPGYVSEVSGSAAAGQAVIKNCVLVCDGTNASAHALRQGARSDVSHCTVVHLGTSANAIEIISSVSSNVSHCYAHSAGGSGINGTAATQTNIHTSDATGDTTSVAYSTANFTNVTDGSLDYTLPSGSALIDQAGASSETEDLLGNARSTPDVGAYEYIELSNTIEIPTGPWR